MIWKQKATWFLIQQQETTWFLIQQQETTWFGFQQPTTMLSIKLMLILVAVASSKLFFFFTWSHDQISFSLRFYFQKGKKITGNLSEILVLKVRNFKTKRVTSVTIKVPDRSQLCIAVPLAHFPMQISWIKFESFISFWLLESICQFHENIKTL